MNGRRDADSPPCAVRAGELADDDASLCHNQRVTDSADRRNSFGLFVLVFVTYGFFYGGGGWAPNSHFDLTRALVERGSVEITPYRFNTGDVAWVDGRAYCNKSPGLSLLAAGPYAILYHAQRAAGIDPSTPGALSLNLYLCTLMICAVSGAVISAVLYSFARRDLGMTRSFALLVSLSIAFATPIFSWSTVFFLHVPNAASLLLAFVWAIRGRSALAGVAAGIAALLNYLCIPLVLVFWVLAVYRSTRRSATVVQYASGAGAVLLVLAGYQLAAFGEVFRNPITTNTTFVSEDAALGFLVLPDLRALYGITISAYRGLFYVAPVLALVVGGAIVMFRDRRLRPEWWATAAVAGLFFGFNLTFNNWEGGFGIGPRYVVATIPLLAIWLLHARGLWRWLWAATLAVSLANNFAATAVDPQPSGSIPRPLTQYIYPLLLTGEFSEEVPITPPWSAETIRGHVAVNPHSPDQYKPFMLHPPDSQESQWASFNLGESLFGVGSPWSLLPIVVWMIGGTAILNSRGRASNEIMSS
jgi:uncharacterized membrane protein YtjA (UPF0391 family)